MSKEIIKTKIQNLRSVDVPIVNMEECKKQYLGKVGNVTIGNICAGKQGKQHCSVRFRM